MIERLSLFIERNKWLLLTIFLVLVACVSFYHLTTFPRFWHDESLYLQVARNFAEEGVLNMQTAPGVPFDKAYEFLTVGYPLYLPLGIVFKIFGVSFWTARVYMIGWLILLLLCVWLAAKELFDTKKAFAALFLIITFAPLFAYARTPVGEAPGITFFFLALYLMARYEKRGGKYLPLLIGLSTGLAVASKPLFSVVAAALLASLFWVKRGGSEIYKKWAMWVALAIPVILFVYLVVPSISMHTFREVLTTYNDRAHHESIWVNIPTNIKRFFTEASMIYILVLSLLVLAAAPIKKFFKRELSQSRTFVGIYALLGLLFFLQAANRPYRYLLLYEIIILFLLPQAISTLVETLAQWNKVLEKYKQGIVIVALCVPVLAQAYQFKYQSNIYSSDAYYELSSIFQNVAPSGSVYLVSSQELGMEAAATVPSSRLYLFLVFHHQVFTPNKLVDLVNNKFDYLFVSNGDEYVTPYMNQINKYYKPTYDYKGKMTLFKRTR